MSIQRVGICLRPDPTHAEPLLRTLVEWLSEPEIEALFDPVRVVPDWGER